MSLFQLMLLLSPFAFGASLLVIKSLADAALEKHGEHER